MKKEIKIGLVVVAIVASGATGFFIGDSKAVDTTNDILKSYDEGVGNHMKIFHAGDPIAQDMVDAINKDVKGIINKSN